MGELCREIVYVSACVIESKKRVIGSERERPRERIVKDRETKNKEREKKQESYI